MVFIDEFYKISEDSQPFKPLHAAKTAALTHLCSFFFLLDICHQMCSITQWPNDYLSGNGRYRKLGKVPKMLERAGLNRKPILHWSKEKTHYVIISDSLCDNIWLEGGTGMIGEQMLFVARESGAIEQERWQPGSRARIENEVKIV